MSIDKSFDSVGSLWKYVTKLEKASGSSGYVVFRCNYCEKVFKGSYSRVKAHILELPNYGIQSCVKVVDEYRMEMQQLEDVFEESLQRAKKPKLVSLPIDSACSPNLIPSESSIDTIQPFLFSSEKRGLGILFWRRLLTINVESN